METILNSMEEFLADFTNLRPKYILAWITARRTELAAADALPGEAARRAASNILYVQLAEQNLVCCALWQKLANYIRGAFPANIVQIQLNAAGHDKYEAAYDKKWAEGKSMLTTASAFLAANLATLTADGNMNPAFATEFNDARTLFNTLLTDFEDSKEAIPMATDEKVDAFNEVYDKVRPMMDDGQEIYRYDPTKRTQFVFADVVARISGPGLAGARGKVISDAGGLPIQGVLATLTLASNLAITHTATTDAEGHYIITCPSGDYILTFTAVGYVPSNPRVVSIAVGTISTFNEKLLPE
jgi:hypothetical protein